MIELRLAIYYFLRMVMYLIFGRAIMSWFIRDYSNPIMKLLVSLTEPILMPIRSLLFRFKSGGNMIDFSPIIALLLVQSLSYMVLTGF